MAIASVHNHCRRQCHRQSDARDRLMREFCTQFPEYCFSQHKRYGTELHLIKLHEHGPCPIHRRSFEPVAQPLLALEGIDLSTCNSGARGEKLACGFLRRQATKFSTAISGLGTAEKSILFAAMATHSSSSK